MNADDARIRDPLSLVLDVRSAEEYAVWHIPSAKNQPFDWLGPPVGSEVSALAKQVAASRAQRVIVYGDGDDPDSGKEWAKLLSGARIKSVYYVEGGAPGLMRMGAP
jgi:rhodanese-related sulfurtransferase